MDLALGAAGLALLLVVPGYLLGRLLFPQQDGVTRAVLAVALSIALSLLAGSVLAFTGLFTRPALWITLVLLSAVLLLLLAIQRQRA